LEEILLLSASHFKFNIAFQESIKQDNPNLTILRKCHNQVKNRALESERGNHLAAPLIKLPLQYAELVNKAIKIRSDGYASVKEMQQKFLAALRCSLLHFLGLLTMTSVLVSLFVIPFDSPENAILRFVALLILLLVRGLFIPFTDMSVVCNIIISMFLIISSIVAASSYTAYVMNMLYFGLYVFLPVFCISAHAFPSSCPCQSFKEFIVEKKKINRKDQKLKKVLFIQ
jgi:hypothetical protein